MGCSKPFMAFLPGYESSSTLGPDLTSSLMPAFLSSFAFLGILLMKSLPCTSSLFFRFFLLSLKGLHFGIFFKNTDLLFYLLFKNQVVIVVIY